MTTRLYYTDALLTRFDATVRSCEPAGTGFDVVLDRTAFYPTSGGQPFDTGRLGDTRVVDVIDRDDDEIVHRVERALDVGGLVAGEVDWDRRFDHMQQHTGQHVLSAAFERLAGVRTTSFHLGAEASTIDLAREVAPAEIDAAEAEACRVVWENRPVHVRFASADEARRLPLRKEPVRAGTLRLVEVEAYDLSACGGTHVPETGRIGIIAVGGWERFKGATRLTLVCGGRALRSHHRLRNVVEASVRLLSVGGDELPAAIDRLMVDGKQLQRAHRRAQEELARFRAADWREGAETIGPWRVVLRAEPDCDGATLKALAATLVREPGFIVILTGGGEPVPVVAARSEDVAWDAGAWIKRAGAALGGRGGGRADLAQGGLTATSAAILASARADLA